MHEDHEYKIDINAFETLTGALQVFVVFGNLTENLPVWKVKCSDNFVNRLK